MRSQSRIQKGRRFENWIANQIEAHGLGTARREIGSGSGKKKGDIFANIPFILEAKNQKTLAIPSWIRQAKEQARIGNKDPDKWALIIRDNETPEANPQAFAVIDLHEFLKLLKKSTEPMTASPDRELKYRLRNLSQAVKQVEKYLPN